MEHKSNNDRIYQQREIFGVDEYSIIHKFVRIVLISDNMVKFKFNENWSKEEHKYKENVSGFIKTIIKYQLMYFVKEQYEKGLTELTYAKNADGLSGVDKLEMQQEKIDEGSVILTGVISELEVERLLHEYQFEITQDELDYYMHNLHIQPLHQQLVISYWARTFGSFRDGLSVSRINMIKLMLLMKKQILRDAGIDDRNTFTDKVVLPYMLTGNIKEQIKTRPIRDAKYKEDCEESYIIKDLLEHKYRYLEEIDPGRIMNLLSMLNNTIFTYCCYEKPDLLGVEIPIDKISSADEMGFLLRYI